MDADSVLEVLDACAALSIRVWLDGGWGVDALLGQQTRLHGDLDLIANAVDVPLLERALNGVGFRRVREESDTNFVYADDRGLEIDVHTVRLNERGYAFFEFPDGRRWPFPPAAFAGEGKIGGRAVQCLSVDAQVQCHGQGYEPTENDLRDMEQLQERFGVVLPIHLCRQTDRAQ